MKCRSIRKISGGSCCYNHNSTPLLPECCLQSFTWVVVIKVGVVVIPVIARSIATSVMMGSGAEIDSAIGTEVTMVIATLTGAMCEDTVVEMSWSLLTSDTGADIDVGDSMS